MKLIYADKKCVLVKFDEKPSELRKQGWLGDELEARVFTIDYATTEIRIFKDNGESYVLNADSKDPMVRYKVKLIMDFVEQATNQNA